MTTTTGRASSAPLLVTRFIAGGTDRSTLIATYELAADSTDHEIAQQAILWGDANADGSLN